MNVDKGSNMYFLDWLTAQYATAVHEASSSIPELNQML